MDEYEHCENINRLKTDFNIDTASAKDLIEFISTDLEFLLSSGIQETPAAEEDIASINKWWKEYKNWLLSRTV